MGRLLDGGLDVNALVENGMDRVTGRPIRCTALIQAVAHKQEGAVRLLLERGADVNLANSTGWTPLMVAAFTDSLPLLPLWRIRAPRFDAHRPPDCTHSSFDGAAFDGEFASLHALLRTHGARAPTAAAHVGALARLHGCHRACIVRRRAHARAPECEAWRRVGRMTSAAVEAFEADAQLGCARLEGNVEGQ